MIKFRDYFEKVVNEKLMTNESLSLRSISNSIGISSTTISDYLRGKTSLSLDNALKAIKWLKIDKEEEEIVLFLALKELSKDKKMHTELDKYLDKQTSSDSYFESKNIKQTIKSADNFKKHIYLFEDQYNARTCLRILFTLPIDEHKPKKLSFYDLFIDLTNQQSGGGYFFKNSDNTYRNYYFEKMSGLPKGFLLDKSNESLHINFQDDFPSIKNMTSKNLITGETYQCDFLYDSSKFTVAKRCPKLKTLSQDTYLKINPSM